ncbi:MAG: rhodanese-like domain-containing protein [Paludibacter sp.]|jgi:adenylyltransferase/sulfurtransferase|nr:rhodanese-like domain-containing protein [Paludibacter sp.]
MKCKVIILSTVIVLLASCGNTKQKTCETGIDLVEAVKEKVDFISVSDFRTVLDSGEKFYLIDCRESEEFNLACIQGALSVPRGILEDEIANQAPSKRVPLFIYCDNGNRSILAASVLPSLKYSCVKVIEGGFDAWQQAFPELVEHNPERGAAKKTVAAPSGGCGG